MLAVTFAALLGCNNYYLPLGSMTVNFPGFAGDAMAESEVRGRIRLPEGFVVNTWASGIENARLMRFTETGDLLVSSPRRGTIYLLGRDQNDDGAADGRRVLLDGLSRPHGVALHDGWLYVGETDAVLRVRFDAPSGTVSGKPERIVRGLPAGGNHWTRTVGIGPDAKLYVSVGSSCNVCIEDDKRRAAIVRYDLDGRNETLYASGLRNAVGFDWRPGTGDLYATDNGRDFLGDDAPPCELDQVVEGGFYGWPFANGNRVPDPDLGEGHAAEIAKSTPPVHAFGAHTAPLGMTFYTGEQFPERYRGAVFVAQHGSWNRARKSGYEVVTVFLAPDGSTREEPFMTGFEVDERVYGRPVDAAVGPDGGLYVSDDFTGSIYRVVHGASAPRPSAGAAGGAEAAPARDPLAAVSAAELERARDRGRKLWEESGCAACHVKAPDGNRGATIRPLGELAEKYGIDSLASFLRAPQPPMPSYPFPEDQRRELAIYLLAEYP